MYPWGVQCKTSIVYKAWNRPKTWLAAREPIQATALFLKVAKKPMEKRAVRLMLDKYLKEVEIRDASVQSLRHTMAVHHLAKGTPVRTIAEILGDDVKMMQTYMVLSRKTHQKALPENAL